MAARQTAPSWHHQDGQVLIVNEGHTPHVQQQWNWRCPDGWEDYPVRTAWREADPYDRDTLAVAERLHRESGMLIISRYGFLQTAYPVWWDDWRDW